MQSLWYDCAGVLAYGLVFSRGNKRTTLIRELPHSWESVEQVLDQLKPWLEGGDVGGDAWFRRRLTRDTRIKQVTASAHDAPRR